ncbi:hypothetical protein [Streptomyces sp. 8N706]|uniref:hypothetical protein n=1 Tax=Streptomyces sp. 8N706 TaxID=3457416 RepID=UPI003FD37677
MTSAARGRDAREGHRQERGIPDGLLVGALGFLLGLTLLVWTATGLSALFARGTWPKGISFTHTPLAMRHLVANPHDLAAAWPEAPADGLSGYGLFWGVLISELMVLFVLSVFVIGVVTRWRALRRAARLTHDAARTPGPGDSAMGPRATATEARPLEAGPMTPGHAGAGPVQTGPVQAGPIEAGPVQAADAATARLGAGPTAGTGAAKPGGMGVAGPGATGTAAPATDAALPATGATTGVHSPKGDPAARMPRNGFGIPGERTTGGPGTTPVPAAGPPPGTVGDAPAIAAYGAPARPRAGDTSPPAGGPPAADAPPAADVPQAAGEPRTVDVPAALDVPPTAAVPAVLPGQRHASGLHFTGPRDDHHTALAVQAILAADGPVLVTTSEPALWTETKGARAKLGPTHLYDPSHLLDTPARLRWSPTAGCESRDIAAARATALLAPVRPVHALDSAMAEAAATLLRCWLHAAAVDGRPFREVHRWASGSAAHEPVRILRTSSKAASGSAGELESTLTGHPQRREVAQQLTARALSALSSIHIRDACNPKRADSLALESFVAEGGTLYVVGEAIEDPRTHPGAMPLLTALVSSVVEHGRRMAERSSAGRLDPPLSLILDDVAAVAPLPQLPELLAGGAAQGIPTLALLRSEEQARARWPHRNLVT